MPSAPPPHGPVRRAPPGPTRRRLALAHRLQRADDVAHLVVQERARPDAALDQVAVLAHMDAAQRLHRRGRLAFAGAEAGEVVAADQRLGGDVHALGVERDRHVPDAAALQGGGARRVRMR